jgi:LmbE family N-acetylglucosaminyl deacetylase
MEYRQRDLYWYDVTSDYRFQFIGGAERHPVRIERNAFTLPAAIGDWHTGMLRVRVRGGLVSKWFEPSVQTIVNGRPDCRQHFERGVRGHRYVSLCLGEDERVAGTRIELSGRHLGWQDQDAELVLFAAPPVESSRILVIAPHADDGEIAAYGLYANRDSWIVTLTAGSYGGRLYRDLADTPAERDSIQAMLRTWDSMVVPTLGGLSADRAINLGYFTTRLAQMHERYDHVVSNEVSGSTTIVRSGATWLGDIGPATSTWNGLVRDLTAIIGRVRPQVIVLPHPALESNQDHQHAAAAVFEALERLGDPVRDLLLYTNHHVHSEYYPFGPAGDAVTLPPWFDESVPFRSVYAPRLDPGRQRAKLFALDAMHDLRPVPERVVGTVPGRIAVRLRDALLDVARDPAGELSYLRRAVRPNELFFAYVAADRAMLQRLGPGHGNDPRLRSAPVSAAVRGQPGRVTAPAHSYR